jgi:hypothetical protein
MQYVYEKHIVPGAIVAFKKTIEAIDYIMTHPTVTRFLDWLESLDIERHYANFRDYCVKLVKQYNAMLDQIKAYWEEFKDIPGMTYIIDYINHIIEGVSILAQVSNTTPLMKFVP